MVGKKTIFKIFIIGGNLLKKIKIKKLRKKDYNKAIRFAIKGMNFNWYLNNKFLLNLYGRYFWYLELNKATQIISAYVKDELVGILLANIKGEKRKHYSFWESFYVKIFDLIQIIFSEKGAGIYEKTNKKLFAKYIKNASPNGEILFLASNTEIKIEGIGSKLLSELEQREKGKTIYLYTDNACTYQFYEHRGFKRVCEENIILDIGNKKIPLKCFIYSKTF